MEKTGIKVTVHSVPSVTSEGHVCKKWPRYFVAAGANPCGPRGGRCGVMMDGERVSSFLSSWEKARAAAEAYATARGAELAL